jgi:hypothetical protein
MKAIRCVRNPYWGINAHLQSYLQADDGGWASFHAAHIIHIAEALNVGLRPLGYRSRAEESLQIQRDISAIARLKADILIREERPRPAASGAGVVAEGAVDLVTLMPDSDLWEERYHSLLITTTKGEPVAWLELLSPSNKGGTSAAYTYRKKRDVLLETGLVFVELDYLHETPPTFETLPVYGADTDAAPYRITVLDPRPEPKRGRGWNRPFGVDEPFPAVTLPLLNGDQIVVDLSTPYRHTFESQFYGDDIDYADYPVHFERYTPSDQARIANRMLSVLSVATRGDDLETGALPVSGLALAAAQAEIAAWRHE